MRKGILACIMTGIILVGQVTAFAAVNDYGSKVNTKNGYKNALAYTSATKGARAKVSMHGGLDDVTGSGYVQTKTISKFGRPTAYIGHGDNGNITIAYEK